MKMFLMKLTTFIPILMNPYLTAYRCAWGLVSKFLFNTNGAFLEGGAVPDCCAESRTVFVPKSSDIDDNGRIIRSPDALRPLTLFTIANFLLLRSVEAFTGTQ